MVQTLLALFVGSVILDALVRPRKKGRTPFRSLAGIWLLLLLTGLAFGLFLALTGNQLAALFLTLGIVGLLTMASNAKFALLGEPLVFSDLALISSIFRHPQFYFTALSRSQKYGLILMIPMVAALLFLTFQPDLFTHLTGLAMLLACLALLLVTMFLSPWAQVARSPDHHADLTLHGLIPTLWLYWVRWRASSDPEPPPPVHTAPSAGELAIVIQCESFADPVEIFGDPAFELHGLRDARAKAMQWGNLLVSGFGAYTMRTEYGLLFGRSEAELGFRRYDPFLTALGETSFALPERLGKGSWRSLFVHPHDMKFYNRDLIMPAAGFTELIAENRFPPPTPDDGRYVTDAVMAQVIIELAQEARQPTLIYAVTIENHGPWETAPGEENLAAGYLRLVRKGDQMLARLSAELSRLERPATLVFFGDHRPSIPGICAPAEERHTPYVIIRFDSTGQIVPGPATQRDLTPAELHHTLLQLWSSGQTG